MCTINGITPGQFMDTYGGSQRSFSQLEDEFTKHCTDYKDLISDLESGKASKALEFSMKILYKISPRVHGVKGIYKCRFVTDDALSIHTIIVTIGKYMIHEQESDANHMYLTFDQARLLATNIILKGFVLLFNKAIYAEDDVRKIAEELNMEVAEVMVILNASCCPGGHILAESDMACAIATTIAVTTKIRNKNMRDRIISKVVQEYYGQQKNFNEDRYKVFCKYALGGEQMDYYPCMLIKQAK